MLTLILFGKFHFKSPSKQAPLTNVVLQIQSETCASFGGMTRVNAIFYALLEKMKGGVGGRGNGYLLVHRMDCATVDLEEAKTPFQIVCYF